MEATKKEILLNGGFAVIGPRFDGAPVETLVYDEDSDHIFTLPGEHGAELLNRIIWIYNRAVKDGKAIGEASMAHKLRVLIGAAPAPVPGRDD